MKNMELYNKIKKEVQEELGDMFDCQIDQYETSGEAEIKRRMQKIDPNDNTVYQLIYERECAIRNKQYNSICYDDMTGEPKVRR